MRHTLFPLLALSLAPLFAQEGAPAAGSDESEPPRDALGDPLPEGALARLGTDRLRHDELVYWVDYVAGGDLLLSFGGDSKGRLWDPATGATRGTQVLEEQTPLVVSYAPAREELVMAGYDGKIEVYGALDGALRERLEEPGFLPALSPDASAIAYVFERNRVRVHDRRTGTMVREYVQPYDVERLSWSPDGRTLAALSLNRLKLNARAGTEDQAAATLQFHRPRDPEEATALPIEFAELPPLRMAWRDDGQMLFAAGFGGIVRALQVPTGLELARFQTTTDPAATPRITSVDLSPDGAFLALGDEAGTLRMVRIESGTIERQVEVGRMSIVSVAFSADGTEIATTAGTSLRLWSASSLAESLPLARHMGPVSCAAYSPNGQWLATGGFDGAIHLWDAASGAHVKELADSEGVGHVGWLFDLAWAPDGSWLVTGGQDGRARIWGIESGELEGQLAGFDRAVTGVDISPDATRLATVGGDRALRVWNIGPERELEVSFEVSELRGVVFHVGFDPSGQQVAVAGSDLRVYSVADGEELAKHEGMGAMVTTLDWAPSGGQLAVGMANSQVRVFDPLSGETSFTLLDHMGRARLVRFSTAGGLMVSGSEGESGVRLWEASSGRRLGEVPGNSRGTLCAVFSNDGQRLFTGGLDGLGLIWDLSQQDR